MKAQLDTLRSIGKHIAKASNDDLEKLLVEGVAIGGILDSDDFEFTVMQLRIKRKQPKAAQ